MGLGTWDSREAYTSRLTEHLSDPAFRAQPGFPSGTDEDILARSAPPFFTACPNPFLAEFLADTGDDEPLEVGPFAADMRAGKTHPLYTAHAYHSKVPHEAIMPYVLHFTRPGEVVLDGFAGSGMTGLAAQLCGAPEPALRARLEAEREALGLQAPEWGARRAVLVDLSPAAAFIAYNLNVPIEGAAFRVARERFFEQLEIELAWMYETRHTDGRMGRIQYTVWSERLECPSCQAIFPFIEAAHDAKTQSFLRRFPCPGCGTELGARRARRCRVEATDVATGERVSQVELVPVAIHYAVPGEKGRFEKAPDADDLAMLERLAATRPQDFFPTGPLPLGLMRDSAHLADRGVTRYHHFYFPRALHALAAMWRLAGTEPDARARQFLFFLVEQAVWGLTKQNRYGASFYSQANRFLGGVFYLPPASSELSPWALLSGKAARLQKLLDERRMPQAGAVCVGVASTPGLAIPEASVDYVYTDPPFGDAIKYGDLNLLVEAWHRLHGRLEDEVLWDELKAKGLDHFEATLEAAFRVYHHALKPGRWMTVVFHNSNNRVWDAIQRAVEAAGFVVADVRTLDRRQGSFNQVTAAGAVKHDLVISAFKPREAGARRQLAEGSAEGVWAFVAEELASLDAGDRVGRSAQMLYSRMVAHHLKHHARVPMAAQAFYEGLERLFSRDAEGRFTGPR